MFVSRSVCSCSGGARCESGRLQGGLADEKVHGPCVCTRVERGSLDTQHRVKKRRKTWRIRRKKVESWTEEEERGMWCLTGNKAHRTGCPESPPACRLVEVSPLFPTRDRMTPSREEGPSVAGNSENSPFGE